MSYTIEITDAKAWRTGDEPMTTGQTTYLKVLSERAGEQFDGELTKAQASQRIDELQRRASRPES